MRRTAAGHLQNLAEHMFGNKRFGFGGHFAAATHVLAGEEGGAVG